MGKLIVAELLDELIDIIRSIRERLEEEIRALEEYNEYLRREVELLEKKLRETGER